MIPANQLKKGTVIAINDRPHIVAATTCQTPSARGGATIFKIRAKDVMTGQKTDLSCKGDESFKEVDYQKKPVEFLYRDQGGYVFIDLEDFSQFELSSELLADESPYLLESMELTALIIDGLIKGVQLPDTVDLKISQCDPGIKGASATARTKNAEVETGYNLQVPEYLEEGEVIKIDTRTGKYLSRAQ
jgi:elongation factor P